jgi:ribonuclease-3
MHTNYSSLEKEIHYTFQDKELISQALTHKTYAFEADTPLEFNERLEFLGDSILNFVIAQYLYTTHLYFSEGELTRRRALLVNNKKLAALAKKLQIGSYIKLGKGEFQQQGQTNDKNLANALEALIGAIYIDSDIQTVESVIFTLFDIKKNE